MTDPLRTHTQRRRAGKRRMEPPAEELHQDPPKLPSLVSQGVRSSLPRPQPSPDDAIRRAALELGRTKWIRIF
jgi:hypothetical protein